MRRIEGDTCAVEGCERPRSVNGRSRRRYCAAHSKRIEKYGHPQADVPVRDRPRATSEYCAVEGCDRLRTQPPSAGLYCGGHANRLRAHGDLYADVPLDGANRHPSSLEQARQRLQQSGVGRG